MSGAQNAGIMIFSISKTIFLKYRSKFNIGLLIPKNSGHAHDVMFCCSYMIELKFTLSCMPQSNLHTTLHQILNRSNTIVFSGKYYCLHAEGHGLI